MTYRPPTPRRRPTSFLARLFGRPAGLAGHLVTRLPARGNAGFNRWLVIELATSVPAPATAIELGCGPGIALQQMLIIYPDAKLIGIDPSPIVLKSAQRRNAEAVRAGRLRLSPETPLPQPPTGPLTWWSPAMSCTSGPTRSANSDRSEKH